MQKEKKYSYKNYGRLKEIRQALRWRATLAEKILWKFIRRNQLGCKFRRQYSIGGVVADFCSEEIKLIIEVDGWTHESEKTQEKDRRKQYFLEKKGYKVIRFTNEQVYGDIEPILKQISDACTNLASRT